MRVSLNDAVQEGGWHRVGLEHFGRVPRNIQQAAGRFLFVVVRDVIHVLCLAGGFPKMVIMVTRNVYDLFEETISLRGKNQLDEAFKHHRRFIIGGQSKFKNVTIKNESWFLKAL